jgi:hypothetical protein
MVLGPNFWHLIYNFSLFSRVSWDSAVGIAIGYGLDDQGVGVGSKFSVLCVIQTNFRVYTTSYTMGRGAIPTGVRRPGSEADHSPTASAEVKEMWIYTSTPPIRLHGVLLN